MGLFRRTARVAVASSVISSSRSRKQAAAAPAAAPAAPVAAPTAAPAAAAAAPDMEGKLALLKQLGELRDAGVLTETEFDAKKAAILAG